MKWKKSANIKHIHMGERRLLPLVVRNLGSVLETDELMPHLRSICKKSWYQNNVFHFHLSNLLKDFAGCSIETMLLKGMASSLFYYKDLGIRPMEDFDVLIKPQDCRIAITLLLNQGWTFKYEVQSPLDEYFFAYKSGLHFENKSFAQCDLNWHLFKRASLGDEDKSFWAQAVPVSLSGSETLILRPEDQLLHLCRHATDRGDTPSARWVADVVTVLQETRNKLDWDRFFQLAGQYRQTLFLMDMLAYLRNTFQVDLPEIVWQKLEKAGVGRTERRYYETTRRSGKIPHHFFNLYWFLHTLLSGRKGGRPWIPGPRALLKYFQVYLDVKYLWQIPFTLTSKTLYRIRMILFPAKSNY